MRITRPRHNAVLALVGAVIGCWMFASPASAAESRQENGESVAESTEDQPEESVAFHPGTMALQTGLGTVAGLAPAGLALWSYGAMSRSNRGFIGILAIPLYALGTVGGVLLSYGAVQFGMGLGGGLMHEGGAGGFSALGGGLIGGAVGGVGTVALFQSDFVQSGGLPGGAITGTALIVLPFVAAMSIGSVIGYHVDRRQMLDDLSREAARSPRWAPVTTESLTRNGPGWTVGGAFRF